MGWLDHLINFFVINEGKENVLAQTNRSIKRPFNL